jgi:hypothetical protein
MIKIPETTMANKLKNNLIKIKHRLINHHTRTNRMEGSTVKVKAKVWVMLGNRLSRMTNNTNNLWEV